MMEHSTQLNELAPALAKAQSEMGGAIKDSANPFFKSKYADLTSVWKACKDALHNNGLSVIQSPVDSEGRIGVSTMLLHNSGQWVRDSFTLGVKKENDPQADGSSITYARRYALAAFVGVCPADDDGERAMDRERIKTAPKSANKPPSPKTRGTGSPPASEKQWKAIWAILKKQGLVQEEAQQFIDDYEKEVAMSVGMASDFIGNPEIHINDWRAKQKTDSPGNPYLPEDEDIPD